MVHWTDIQGKIVSDTVSCEGMPMLNTENYLPGAPAPNAWKPTMLLGQGITRCEKHGKLWEGRAAIVPYHINVFRWIIRDIFFQGSYLKADFGKEDTGPQAGQSRWGGTLRGSKKS